MIPNRISFFWCGDRLSYMRYLTLYSFRQFHKDWQIVLYRMPENMASSIRWGSLQSQDAQSYKGQDYSQYLRGIKVVEVPWEPGNHLPSNLAPSHACDFCQWEILSIAGGWFADMDILWTGSLPTSRTEKADAVFCLSDGWMTIGLMASAPESSFFEQILEVAKSNYNPKQYQSTGAEAFYRHAGIWPRWSSVRLAGEKSLSLLRKQYPELSFVEIPSATVYPFNYLSVDKIFDRCVSIPDGCRGIHWFGVCDIAQKWNSRLTENNWRNYDNTFTRCMRSIL